MWGGRLPFVGRIFWVVLPTVFILAVVGWWVAYRYFGYEMTRADYGGSFICWPILSYLLHLWLLPPEHLHHGDEDFVDDETPEEPDEDTEA